MCYYKLRERERAYRTYMKVHFKKFYHVKRQTLFYSSYIQLSMLV